MDVLIHLGLNKCASTFIQHALAAARSGLAEAGILYPATSGPPAQYGLSRAYGFGPEAPEIRPVPVAGLVAEARRRGAERMILSSEYLSLHRPAAAARLVGDLADAGCRATFLFYSRPIVPWIRSLFNQYLRTVDDGRPPADIDAFVDHVLANGAIDVRRRHDMWAPLAGPGRLIHLRMPAGATDTRILAPFAAFAGTAIGLPEAAERNASLSAGALYRISQLRARPRGRDRDREIGALIAGAPSPVEAPRGFLEISSGRMARLEREIIRPYDALSGGAI